MRFYLNNYRALHHILGLIMFFIALYFVFDFKEEITTSLPFQILILFLSYFTTEYSLKKSGLKKQVEEEIDKLKNKKDQP
jgi:hypothetical protein